MKITAILAIFTLLVLTGCGHAEVLDTNEAQDNLETNQDTDMAEKLKGTVTINVNHALAGKTLNFDVEMMKIEKGEGNTATDTVEKGDSIEVHYNGTLEDGEKFDSSYDRGQTLPFKVGAGQMIPGFDAGVVGMKLEEKKTLVLAPKDAYGEYDETKVQEIPKADLESFVAAGFKLEVGEKLPTQVGVFEIIKVTDK